MTPTPSYLPPERPFTAEVRTRLRARILRDISEPGPRRGRLLVPLAAAAALLLVVALSLLLTRGDQEARIVPAVQPRLRVPGYSTQQLDKLSRECGASFDAHEGRDSFSGMRLYNVHKDAAGLLALFYGPNGDMQCGYEGYHADKQRPAVPVPQAGSSGGLQTTWLEMPVQTDGGGAMPGGDVSPGSGFPGRVGYWQFYGRVAPYVVRVELVVGGKSASVPVVNGTFIVTVFTSKDDRVGGASEVLGYRQDGSVVRNGSYATGACVTAPDGTMVRGDPPERAKGCLPAIRWR